MSNTITDVGNYIDTSIFNSGSWDDLDTTKRTKIYNNAIAVLLNVLKRYYIVADDIPVDVLSHEIVWLARIDDTFLRAEMGATYIQMSGVMVNIANKDRSIAPYVMEKLDITPDALTGGVTKRKVGSYSYRPVGTPYSRLRREQ